MTKRTLAVAISLAFVATGLLAMATLGDDPTASPAATAAGLLEGGDLRSGGAGPGVVGNPLLILGAVIALGLVTALLTFVIVRLVPHD